MRDALNKLWFVAVIGAAITAALPTSAQETRIRLELNKLEAAGENCRAYFLIDNRGAESWRSLKLDLFALDTDGVAAKRVAVEVGPISEKKTHIKVFDFAGLACPRFGRILLNEVMTCEGGTNSREECLAMIETDSKVAAVPLEK